MQQPAVGHAAHVRAVGRAEGGQGLVPGGARVGGGRDGFGADRVGGIDQWITGLAAGHRTFAERLADRQSQMIPSEDPDYGNLGRAFPAWTSPGRNAILQPPKPEIPPSPRILEQVMDRDADWEAAD